LRRHDGEYRWHLSQAVPFRGGQEGKIRWYGTATDIHDQKLLAQDLERRVALRTEALKEALQEAESFNYAISHDLRSPLRAIVATSKMLMHDLGETLSEEHLSMLERQGSNAVRLAVLIDELLALSRYSRAEVQRQTLDMSQKALEIAEELRL